RDRALEVRDVLERHGLAALAPDGHVFDRRLRLEGTFGILRSEEVMVAVAWVDPERLVEGDARREGGDDVPHRVARVHADETRLLAVDVEEVTRRVETLLDADVHRARHLRDAPADLLREVLRDLEALARDLH